LRGEKTAEIPMFVEHSRSEGRVAHIDYVPLLPNYSLFISHVVECSRILEYLQPTLIDKRVSVGDLKNPMSY
jgi:hypothetical protein